MRAAAVVAAVLLVASTAPSAAGGSPASAASAGSPASPGVPPKGASSDAPRGAYADVNGVRIWYEVRGAGAPVVLLHGGMSTIETSFEKVLPELTRRYRVVAVEQVGHGHSPDADRPYSYARMADDTAAVLRNLRIERADLVGWSDGAEVALQLAIRHPQLVRRMVLSGVTTALAGMEPKALQSVRDTSAEEMARKWGPLREAYERASPDGAAHWPRFVAKVRALWLDPAEQDMGAAKVAAIAAPTLVVAGDRDTVRPEHAVELFRNLRHGQLCILPGTGHGTFRARAEWLLPIITAFLDAPEKAAK